MESLVDHQPPMNKILWDCDSSLYDSFELKSFKRQLDAAIVSRTMSMQHFSFDPPPSQPPKKQQPKLVRKLNKLIRSVFRRKVPEHLQEQSWQMEHGIYCSENYSYTLSTIPEVCEKSLESPEFNPVVRKTVSERFTASTTTAGLLRMPVT